jgi:hypothetical protein
LKSIVVLGAIPLEVVAQVEERLRQDGTFAQEERDHEPANTSVSVQERMDRLELRMCKSGVDERWQAAVSQEGFEVPEDFEERVRGRGDVERVVERAALRTDPVLGVPKLAGLAILTANPRHERGVDLLDEAQRQWQVVQAPQALVHRADVVDDLLYVFDPFAVDASLVLEDVG